VEKIKTFIKNKEEERKNKEGEEGEGVEVEYRLYQVKATTPLFGAAKNLGVRYTKGDVLFFAEPGAFWLPPHLWSCFSALVHPSFSRAYVRSSILKDQSYKSALDLCVWKNVHNFVEGFPESLIYYTDVNSVYIQNLEDLKVETTTVEETTLVQTHDLKLSLELTTDLPCSDWDLFCNQTSWTYQHDLVLESLSPTLTAFHTQHLTQKMERLHNKERLGLFDVDWKIYHSLNPDETGFSFSLQTHPFRYQQLLGVTGRVTSEVEAGKAATEDLKGLLYLIPMFLYDKTLQPPTFFHQYP